MRIHRITLRNYRGTTERTLEFFDGVTVIEGRNEVGKSTLVEALRHLRIHKATTLRKEVRDTQPVGRDVGPEVEVELSTGEYRLTYYKQWLRGKRTELNITAPNPERLSGDDAHERFLQIVAETTDGGLFEALEVLQGNSLGQASLARLPALRKALDGAGPSTGEHDALLEAVEKEYLRYFTQTGKPTGDLARGQKELASLAEEVRALEKVSREIDSLTERHGEAVAARDAKGKRLEQAREQEAELVESSRALDELRQRADRAAKQIAEATAARETAERLARDREDAKALMGELDATLAETLTGVEQARQRASHAQDTLVARAEEARNAEEEEGALRAQVCEIDNRIRQARDVAELEALKERLERLAEAERRLHDAVAVLNANTVDEDACRMLEKVEVTARIARETWETRAARVAIEVADKTLLDGETLEPGTHGPIPVKAPVVVEVPGYVRITVSPGDGTDDVERRAREAEDALTEALVSHGIPDVAAARAMAEEHNQARKEREAANETIRLILGDENEAELRARAEALDESVGDLAAGELAGVEEERSGIAAAVEAAAVRTAGARVALESARATQQQAREDLIREEAELRHLEARGDDASTRLEAARADTPDEKIGEAVTEATAAFEKCVIEKDAVDKELEFADAAGLDSRLGNARAVVTRLTKESGDLDEELTRLSTLLDDRLAGGTYDRLSGARARLEQAEARQASRQRAADAVSLLRKTLNRHRAEAQLRYVAPFRERIEALGRLVFGPDLAVEVTPELNIASRTLAGETVPFQSLSSGAREQLSLLGRLACAQLVQPGEGVPLIIDDALGFADPDRLTRLGAVLNRVGEDVQTIILTCQPERFDQIGGAHVIRL